MSNTVFVRGFDFTTTQEQVEAHCSQAGIVQSVKHMRGSAVVTFASHEEAAYAIELLNQSVIEGNTRYIDVKFDEHVTGVATGMGIAKGNGKGFINGGIKGGAKRAPEAPAWAMGGMAGMAGLAKKRRGNHKDEDPVGSGRVFVRGFDFGTTDEQFEGHMGAVGEIHACHWVTKGSAVVVYKDAASAIRAAGELNGTIIEGNTRYMDVTGASLPTCGGGKCDQTGATNASCGGSHCSDRVAPPDCADANCSNTTSTL